jgi:hypothetical protein
MKNINPYYLMLGFCIPVNLILIFIGIFIGDPFAIVLACLSMGLIMLPLTRNDTAEEETEKNEKDKRSPPR